MTVAPSSVVGADQVLTADALEFVLHLDRLFHERRDALLGARLTRRKQLAAGQGLDFLSETAHIRSAEWQVAKAPADLLNRRVEINVR